MIASLVKTQFHPILKQAICKQEVFLKQINFLDKETKKERREKKTPNTSQLTIKSLNTWFY